MRYLTQSLTCWLALQTLLHALAAESTSSALPLFRVVDLNRGETAQTTLSDGKKVTVKLLEVNETRDAIRSAVRLARVSVEVDGRKLTLDSGNYRLPVKFAGVQIDCPITKGYYVNCDPFEDSWGLEKDARLRIWPANSPWFEREKFTYPARQRWFATQTQTATNPRMSMAEIVRRAKFTIIPGTTSAAAKV